MNSNPMISKLAVLQLGSMLVWSGSVDAHLGSDLSSVRADSIVLHGVVRTTALVEYDVHEIDAAAGLTVREFVTRGGTVFALSWAGPVPPDLQLLLGNYFGAYAAGLAALKSSGRNRSVRVELTDLIVESGGHLRAYSGRAYLPALMPAGVSIADLR
ncbi:MAG: DUF2844 domain-containing protein [Steroidobacterales bacterium]